MKKITSQEQWEKIYEVKGLWTFPQTWQGVAAPWWACREMWRIQSEQYLMTEPLHRLNKKFPVFAHVSETEPEKVAFTPDRAAGEADRQIVTTLGKLMLRLCSVWSDDFIRNEVEEHKSACDTSFEIATGAQIVELYKSEYLGSCMHSKLIEGHHPTEVYDTPDLALAYLMKDGKCAARTLVRPDRKEFLRFYGDPRLKRNLIRAGYTQGDLVGVKLKRIKLGEDKYLVPYLDGPGTPGSTEYSCVTLGDDENYIQVVNGVGSPFGSGYVYNAGTTSHASICYARLMPVTDEVRYFTDELTGFRYDRLNSEDAAGLAVIAVRFTPEGRNYLTNLDISTVDRPFRRITLNSEYVFVPAEYTFYYGGSYYLDTPDIRRHKGFRQLSNRYYEGTGWYLQTEEAVEYRQTLLGLETVETLQINEADTATLIVGTDTYTIHKDSPLVSKASLKAGKLMKVHSLYRNHPTYAYLPSTTVEVTSTGRKVVPNVHSVKMLNNGTWEMESKVETMRIICLSVRYNVTFLKGNAESRAENTAIAMEQAKTKKLANIWRDMANVAYARLDNGEWSGYGSDRTPTWNNTKKIKEVFMQRHSLDALEYHFAMQIVEALAEEAPHRLGTLETETETEQQTEAAVAA